MKLKRFALRGLIILAVVVALCMFFARTVQTITTPKVRLLSPGKGRLEQEIKLTAQAYFPETEDIILDEAKKSAVTVAKVYVKPGHYVEAGDVIFTSAMPTYEEDMKKLKEEYAAKAQELAELDITNRKLSKESRQNELYEDMMAAQDAMAEQMYEARKAALGADITLIGDVGEWKKQLAAVKDVPREVTSAVNRAVAAKATYDEARSAFFAIFEDRKMRVSTEVFNYIKDRNKLIEAMQQLADDMLALDARVAQLAEVRAPRSGWISSVNVTAGESYDGSKAAYVLSAEESLPVLRASLTGVERKIADGTNVTVGDGDSRTERTKVASTMTDATGAKWLLITMPESMAKPGGSAVRQVVSNEGVQVSITYRAKQSTTLLPASAVRSDGDSSYVFLVQQNYGGFLSGSGMKLVKTSVTVIERNDKQVSIGEDLGYQQIAYQEDRALSDGMTVMEYVN